MLMQPRDKTLVDRFADAVATYFHANPCLDGTALYSVTLTANARDAAGYRDLRADAELFAHEVADEGGSSGCWLVVQRERGGMFHLHGLVATRAWDRDEVAERWVAISRGSSIHAHRREAVKLVGRPRSRSMREHVGNVVRYAAAVDGGDGVPEHLEERVSASTGLLGRSWAHARRGAMRGGGDGARRCGVCRAVIPARRQSWCSKRCANRYSRNWLLSEDDPFRDDAAYFATLSGLLLLLQEEPELTVAEIAASLRAARPTLVEHEVRVILAALRLEEFAEAEGPSRACLWRLRDTDARGTCSPAVLSCARALKARRARQSMRA
jgi:hypothetical protein